MKKYSPELPKDTLSKHKLTAYTTLLATRDFIPDKAAENIEVVVHSGKSKGPGLVKELQSNGLKVIAFCHGNTCRWNNQGINLENGKDKELSLSPTDTYNLIGDVIVFDEVRDYINFEDSKSLSAKVIVETGNFITQHAKDSLKQRGLQVIPHQFFELYPLEAARPENLKKWSERMGKNWEKVRERAKVNQESFEEAFEYLISQKMV